MAGVLDVLLDLPLLPPGSRIAELGFEQKVADHRCEPRVDLAVLAAADLVDRGAHVVVDASPQHAAQHALRTVFLDSPVRRDISRIEK